MPANRDTLFPSASIGKAGGSQIQRTASHESLNAHPLLSSNSPSSSISNQTHSGLDSSPTTAPRYVPYTPRHRPPTSSATIGMTTHASMPVASNQQGGATSKLQLQNLKAAAQSIGLGNGTVGWAILEKLVDGETGPEWDEIWAAITAAKPTFLLPLEPFSGEAITPDFVSDHVAFCGGFGSTASPLVTLSGLRGFISNSTLTLQSTLPVTSKHFRDLFKPDLQSSALISLPPLPSLFTPIARHSLPSFALPGFTSLPLPPRIHHSKPPLPPRPTAPSSTFTKPPIPSRIPNPFASLFGRPPPSPVAGGMPTSPSQPSLHGEEVHHNSANTGVDVAAFSLGKKIIKKTVGKELTKVIKEEIRGSLTGCPTWVVDRVIDFTGPLHALPKSPKRIDVTRSASGSRSTDVRPQALSILPFTQTSSDPSALAEAFQTFYASIEDDLRAAPPGSPLIGRRKEEGGVVIQGQGDTGTLENDVAEDGKEKAWQEERKGGEAGIKEILEQVERAICSVFYDRTFRPLAGDDVSHDDALANRIAALNMLDLGLEHLGVEIPTEAVKNGVDGVVKSCGEALQRLEDSEYHSPRDKCALLVEAHKRIVDGLSLLPQLRLKPESDFEEQDEKTPRASTFGRQAAQEAMDEASAPSTVGSEQAVVSKESMSDIDMVSSPQTTGALSIQPPEPGTEPIISEEAPGTHASTVASAGSPLPLPLRTHSPPPSSVCRPSTVSGDLLFPLLIFSVVKANPVHLVSHLLYTQRFRARHVGGQESYCLINLMAVVEFLEHVDMDALGLGDSERIMNTADLTPIPLARGHINSTISPPSPLSSRLGKRVNQQVEELAGLAGSANKVITGVVDSSFGVLRGFLTSNPDLPGQQGEIQDAASWNTMRPGFGLLKRGSSFSIASVAASLPGSGRPRTPGATGEEGQQLIEVSSRPGSIREYLEDDNGDESRSTVENSEDELDGDIPDRGDTRSVRSFSSMMSRESRDHDRPEGKERKSLTDRLASMSALSRFGTVPPGDQHGIKASPPSPQSASRPSSWLPPPPGVPAASQSETPASSSTSLPSPPTVRIPPPNRRFLECAEQDIRVGEVGELLREYRRMVQALRASGSFEDHV